MLTLDDIENLTVAKLKEEFKTRGLDIPKGLKADLINALKIVVANELVSSSNANYHESISEEGHVSARNVEIESKILEPIIRDTASNEGVAAVVSSIQKEFVVVTPLIQKESQLLFSDEQSIIVLSESTHSDIKDSNNEKDDRIAKPSLRMELLDESRICNWKDYDALSSRFHLTVTKPPIFWIPCSTKIIAEKRKRGTDDVCHREVNRSWGDRRAAKR